jgi:antitoxin MazE
MRNESRIAKWGNSLAVRIPLAIAKQASLAEGDSVKLALDGKGGIILRPARRRYELSDLVAQITHKNRRLETDWVRLQGKESW